MTIGRTEFDKLQKTVDRLEKDVNVNSNKNHISQLYTNQANISNRVHKLEEHTKRDDIVKDLKDVSKTGIANYTLDEIAEKNNTTTYEIKKIQKEEGLSRDKSRKVKSK